MAPNQSKTSKKVSKKEKDGEFTLTDPSNPKRGYKRLTLQKREQLQELVLEQGILVARACRILKINLSIAKKRVQQERARGLQRKIKIQDESVNHEIDCGAPFPIDFSAASEHPLLFFWPSLLPFMVPCLWHHTI